MALARGQITITNEADILENIKVGGRNLAKGSKMRRVVAASSTNAFNAASYALTIGRVHTHQSYAVSAWVEVLAGGIDEVTAYIYGAHSPQQASYDRHKGGAQRLTWVFAAEPHKPAVESAHPLYIYAGHNGHTIGNSIAIAELCIVEGNIPPQSWTPTPEELDEQVRDAERKAKAYADTKAQEAYDVHLELARSLQKANERMASLNYLKSVLKKGKLEPMSIKGGEVVIPLILNNYIGILDLAGKLRASLSGDTAGGTFLTAGLNDQGTPTIEIKHNGDARFGLMKIEQTPMGSVITYLDPNAETVGPLLRIGGSQTPLRDLIDRSAKTLSIRVPEQTITMVQPVQAYEGGRENARETIQSTERVVVPKTGKARIRCRIELDLELMSIPNEYSHAYSYVEIGIGGSTYITPAFSISSGVNIVDTQEIFNVGETFEVDETIDNIPAGTYPVSITAILAVYGNHSSEEYTSYASLTARIGAIQVDALFVDTSVREVVFGAEGLSAFFGHNRFVYLSRHPDLPVLSARGRINLPGVILSGYVEGGKQYRTSEGKRYYKLRNLYNPLELHVVCYDGGSNGYYTIQHNGNIEGLAPQATAVGLSGVPYSLHTNAVVANIGSNSFQIWLVTPSGETRQDFTFTLIGNNY